MYKIQKQKKRPVLDITGFFFCMSTQVKAEVRMRKKIQRPVSSAPISGLYHRPLLAACK